MLYKDLTALTKWMSYSCLFDQSGNNVGPYDQCSSFHLVQTWAWERFPRLKPVQNYMLSSENFPRLARWSKVKIVKDIDLSSAIDSSGKAFLWRPYGKHEGRDPESLAEWIKTTDIIGIDSCIERYEPERVSRQFGLNEDILNDNIDKKTDKNLKLLAKSAKFQSTITSCYDKWWKKQGYSKVSREKVKNVVDSDPPPGFPPKIIILSVVASDSDDNCRIQMKEPSKLPGSAFPSSVASPDQQQSAQIKIMKDIDLSSAQCIKTTDLNGIDSCIERYQTEHVSRQFGLNKDILNDNIAKKTDQNMKLLAKSANFQSSINSCYEKWCNQQGYSRVSREKVENMIDNDPPPGFPPKIIILSVVASDNDCRLRTAFPCSVASPDQQQSAQIKMEDCVVNESVDKIRMTELLKLPFLETGSRMSFLSSNASVDMEIEDDNEEFVQSEAKQDKREAADTEHDEIQGKEGIRTGVLGAKRSYLATSYTNERSKDSSFDLEARITRLESIVYAHIKALETDK